MKRIFRAIPRQRSRRLKSILKVCTNRSRSRWKPSRMTKVTRTKWSFWNNRSHFLVIVKRSQSSSWTLKFRIREAVISLHKIRSRVLPCTKLRSHNKLPYCRKSVSVSQRCRETNLTKASRKFRSLTSVRLVDFRRAMFSNNPSFRGSCNR